MSHVLFTLMIEKKIFIFSHLISNSSSVSGNFDKETRVYEEKLLQEKSIGEELWNWNSAPAKKLSFNNDGSWGKSSEAESYLRNLNMKKSSFENYDGENHRGNPVNSNFGARWHNSKGFKCCILFDKPTSCLKTIFSLSHREISQGGLW